jgi:hypothetical protein
MKGLWLLHRELSQSMGEEDSWERRGGIEEECRTRMSKQLGGEVCKIWSGLSGLSDQIISDRIRSAFTRTCCKSVAESAREEDYS